MKSSGKVFLKSTSQKPIPPKNDLGVMLKIKRLVSHVSTKLVKSLKIKEMIKRINKN